MPLHWLYKGFINAGVVLFSVNCSDAIKGFILEGCSNVFILECVKIEFYWLRLFRSLSVSCCFCTWCSYIRYYSVVTVKFKTIVYPAVFDVLTYPKQERIKSYIFFVTPSGECHAMTTFSCEKTTVLSTESFWVLKKLWNLSPLLFISKSSTITCSLSDEL